MTIGTKKGGVKAEAELRKIQHLIDTFQMQYYKERINLGMSGIDYRKAYKISLPSRPNFLPGFPNFHDPHICFRFPKQKQDPGEHELLQAEANLGTPWTHCALLIQSHVGYLY